MISWTPDIFVGFYEFETRDKIRTYSSDLSISNDQKAIEELRKIYEKSDGKLEVYGSVEEMLQYFKRIQRIEQNGISSHVSFPSYTDVSGQIICVSNSDVIEYMKLTLETKLAAFLDSPNNQIYQITEVAKNVSEHLWQIAGLKNETKNKYHKMINDDSWRVLHAKLSDLCNFANRGFAGKEWEMRAKQPIKFKKCGSSQRYINDLFEYLEMLKLPNITETWNAIAHLNNLLEPLRDELRALGNPQKGATLNYKPVIRRFKGANYEFYLAREVSDTFPKENIALETDEDIKQKRIFTVDCTTFDQILQKHGADSVIIVEIPIETNSRNNTYPIYSSYGFHCRPAWEAFEDFYLKNKMRNLHAGYLPTSLMCMCHVMFSLLYVSANSNGGSFIFGMTIVVRKYFLHAKNVTKMYDVIESKEFDVFVEHSTMYLVDCVIHPELVVRDNWNYNISELLYLKEYTKNEVTEILNKFVENHNIDGNEMKGIIDKVFQILPKNLTYKQIYDLYFRIILRNVLKLCPKIARLHANQGKYRGNRGGDSDLIHEAVQEFDDFKNGNISEVVKERFGNLRCENIELKKRETNYIDEIKKLKEQLAIREKNHMEEIGKLNEQVEQHQTNFNKLKEEAEQFKERQRDFSKFASQLKNRVEQTLNDLVDNTNF
ncbi:unnamed protein product [Caenorhabditis angaria]|uniref:Uncharacterized protein n=1 Tax=Caenorhabditis angaria TaxID=860376 RepID=A0A9P1N3X8_9PELO|nr:unnamed protein product [Caenorhabditis angaria]